MNRIVSPDPLLFFEELRDKKYYTENVDRSRYRGIWVCYNNGWHYICEEPPRSGKSEAIGVFSVAWWLATHPNFKFGLITHSQALGCKFLAAVARLLRDLGFEFEYVDEMGDRMVAFIDGMSRLTGLRPEAVLVERAAAGYGIIDRYSGKLPIVPVFPTGSKEDRAGSVCDSLPLFSQLNTVVTECGR